MILNLGKIMAPNMFHCRNLTLLRAGGHFHPSSNYLQYRPHVHYRRHLTHLNTPECRCTIIPIVCHDPFATERFLNTSRIDTERLVKTSQTVCRWWKEFCSLLYDITAYDSYSAGLLKVSILLCVPRMTPLYSLNPSQYRELYVLRRATAHFSPAD